MWVDVTDDLISIEKSNKILTFCKKIFIFIRYSKPWLRPTALAFPKSRPGQKPSQAKGQAWLGLASGVRPEPAHYYLERTCETRDPYL